MANASSKDIITLVMGFLSALLLFLQAIGNVPIWLSAETIGAFGQMLTTFVPLLLSFYAIWKNTYVSKQALVQKQTLIDHGEYPKEAVNLNEH